MLKKSESVRTKLLFSVLLVTLFALLATSGFSILYFYYIIKSEASLHMESNGDLARILYEDQVEDVGYFSSNLAADRAVQVIVDLQILNKLSEYLKEVVGRDNRYHITVLSPEGEILAAVGREGGALTEHPEISLGLSHPYVSQAIQGTPVSGTERVVDGSGVGHLSISSAYPVVRAGNVRGVILVRFLHDDNPEFIENLGNELSVRAGVILDGMIHAGSPRVVPIPEVLVRLTLPQKDPSALREFREARMGYGQAVTEYMTLNDLSGRPVGILGLSLPSDRYAATFLRALLFLVMIMVCMLILATIFVYLISKTILTPLNTLVLGAKKIADGDLSYEIMTDLRDEIGKLSIAFNNMRQALREKITTIEDINDNLEGMVRDRTETIESLMEAMKRYLPTQLYDAIVGGTRNTDVTSHYRKKLTIFFSDIVNFTNTTEKMEAEDLSEVLNTYLNEMSRIALKWGGTIDKFIGDAVMVFFGDPEFTSDKDHALRAVHMAMEMLEKMKELRIHWIDRGIDKPLHIRIGINTGYCTVGNFGSEDRMDYTIIGGNVNLASRFETAASPDSILISHETWSLIKDEIECELAGQLQLKGISDKVPAYRVIGAKDASETQDYLTLSQEGLHLRQALVAPGELSEEQRQDMIKNLRLATMLLRGQVEYKQDPQTKAWRVVRISGGSSSTGEEVSG